MIAKRTATTQHLTEAQFTQGIGVDYVEGKYNAINVPSMSASAGSERLELIDCLFTEGEVTFDGESYSIDELRFEPTMT